MKGDLQKSAMQPIVVKPRKVNSWRSIPLQYYSDVVVFDENKSVNSVIYCYLEGSESLL